jgi:DNA-binding GntR family transcriptional regulator
MSPGPTFDRVYKTLKGRLVAGDFAPGEHLEPAALGEQFFSSATPVRDVLHRLVGERLVEAARSDGFRVPSPTEAELRGLYGWRKLLLDHALKSGADIAWTPAIPTLEDLSGKAAADQFFLAIARRSSRRELEAAIVNAGERLGIFRQAEAQLITDLGDETGLIWQSLSAADWPMVRRTIAAFHRRRQRLVPELLEAAWRIAHNRQIASV